MSLSTFSRPVESVAELEAIIKAELDYWNHAECDGNTTLEAMSVAAVGACSNIISAIHGWRAEWHPQPERKVGEPCPTSQL